MPMFTLLLYNNNYSKAFGSLWQYCRDEPNDNIAEWKSFKIKLKFRNCMKDAGYSNVEIAILLNI